ncbi:T9SS type A sorting domain-containing protein [Flavobacterium sp.]|uniref:T9SS type A sorting domain-containing protein n=1 Tax=Flavobacterium sp. TaxID=239 RepID=UPI0026050BCE|nr:T9SS type A sorting domain-containing protein [Flavobacterium sp.]
MKKTITFLVLFITLQMSAQCWQSISTGYDHSLAVKNDGTLWAWGSNGTRKLGDGTNIDKTIPTQIGFDTNWQQVCANFSSSFAIKTDGTLWAWGWNYYGDLGLGTTSTSQGTPIQVGTETNWQSISSSNDFCIALKTDGTLWAWGRNDYGQLGDNTTIYRNIPTQIGTDTNWQSVSVGHYHCMAIKSNGTLWGWGWNSNGKLGDGTNINRLVPTQIGIATNWQKVDAGFNHSLAIKTDGTLWAWGTNYNGEFGMVTSSFISNIPIQIGTDTDWQDVSASQWFTYAIKTNKTLWSTGRNEEGQLGNGTSGTTDVLVFTQVGTFSDSNKIATGWYHVLNTNQDGFIRVTGKNDKGQLGDGTTVQKNSITTISCYPTVLSNEEFAINTMKVYPNPVNDILNISLDNEIDVVSIFNLLGQEVMTKSVNSNQTLMDISNLSAGTYLVKVASGNEVKTVKVVKN